MNHYDIDPSLRGYSQVCPPFTPFTMKAAQRLLKLPLSLARSDLNRRTVSLSRPDGTVLKADVLEPENSPEELPVLVYFHGGGFGYPASPYQRKLAELYAAHVPCRVILPDYRLLPEHPYPAAREDADQIWEWAVMEYPQSLKAAGDDSAGAVLASYVVKDAAKKPDFQLLVYPVCSQQPVTASRRRFTDTPLWNAENNERMWEMYLPEGRNDAASPLQMELPESVPDAYVELAQYDCLHDEGLLYAARLKEAGAKLELNNTKGTYHGYDINLSSRLVWKQIRRRIQALKKGFYGETKRDN